MKTYDNVFLDYLKPSNNPYNVRTGLTEYFSKDYVFCMCSENNRQLSLFSGCRAYLGDTVWASFYHQDYRDVFYSVNLGPVDTNHLRICVSQKYLNNNIEYIEYFFHKMEKDMGFEKTKIFYVENIKKHMVYMFVADKRWLIPPMLSFYTLCIRNLFNVSQTIKTDTWQQTIKKMAYQENFGIITPFILEVCNKNFDTFFYHDLKKNYPSDLGRPSEMHNFGIEVFSNDYIGVLTNKQRNLIHHARRFMNKFYNRVVKMRLRHFKFIKINKHNRKMREFYSLKRKRTVLVH